MIGESPELVYLRTEQDTHEYIMKLPHMQLLLSTNAMPVAHSASNSIATVAWGGQRYYALPQPGLRVRVGKVASAPAPASTCAVQLGACLHPQ